MAGIALNDIKQAPFSHEAEQSVIGGLLLDQSAWDDVSVIVSVDDFYSKIHRTIFQAASAILSSGRNIDLITLQEELESTGKLDSVGGFVYLVEIVRVTPSAANIIAYAKIVKERSLTRSMIAIGNEMVESGYNTQGKAISEITDSFQSKLSALVETGSPDDKPSNMNDALNNALDKIEEAQARGGSITGLSTGFVDLDKLTSGLQPADMIVLAGRPSMGKELQNDSLVYMLDGTSKRIGDIMVGDIVASIDGCDSEVVGVFPQGVKDIYKVTFSDGRSVNAGIDHLWEVKFKGWKSTKVLSTKDVIELMKVPAKANRLSIPFCSGDFGVDVGLSIDPYLLGVLIGDGGLSAGSIRVSNPDEFILEKIKPLTGDLEIKHICGIDYAIRCNRGSKNWLIKELRKFGLFGRRSNEKFVPDNYLSASRASRLSLINGLIDTDGTIEKHGSMTYTTTSEKLSTQFLSLARSLGYWAKLKSRITKYTYNGEIKNGKRSYTITIQGEKMAELVTLPRKKERLSERRSGRNMNLTFSSIEKIGSDECTCISVSHDRSLFLTNEYIATHNTTLGMNIADHVAQTSGRHVMVFSLEMPEDQLTRRLLASNGMVNLTKINNADLDDDDWGRLSMATGKLMESKMLIDDAGGLTPAELRARAKRAHKEHGLGLILIDYMGLMRVPSISNNRNLEISEISRSVNELAKELNVPIIALSQLNRSLEQRADKRPVNSDLRDSGSIEQDADLILFVYRDEVYNDNSPDRGTAELIIGKQRNGPLGKVRLTFQGEYSRFCNFAGPRFNDEY